MYNRFIYQYIFSGIRFHQILKLNIYCIIAIRFDHLEFRSLILSSFVYKLSALPFYCMFRGTLILINIMIGHGRVKCNRFESLRTMLIRKGENLQLETNDLRGRPGLETSPLQPDAPGASPGLREV